MKQKIYFRPGDLVRVRHDLPNAPVMMVEYVDKISPETAEAMDIDPLLLGVRCMWFTTDMQKQTHRYNTKDLVHYRNVRKEESHE